MTDETLYRYLDCQKFVRIDSEGYLENREDWNEEIANALANDEALELTAAHWEVIYLLRDFYARYEMAPAMRALVKAARQQLGEQKGSSIYLMSLFPGSPAKRAARIAGLPKPTNCL